MNHPHRENVVISFLRGAPSPSLVSLFRQAFPHHPASSCQRNLTAAFLASFALRGTFIVARAEHASEEIGLIVGGDASVLDRTRQQFIRSHSLAIAASLMRGRLPLRALVARVRRRPRLHQVVHAPYQLRFIAVSPNARGSGTGTLLLSAFERTVPSGLAYHAWTLEGPAGAEGFYLARGFQRDLALNGHLRMWKPAPEAHRGHELRR